VKQRPPVKPALVLFDGPCNLCNASVLAIIDHDSAGRFRFASLQSVVGKAALEEHGLLDQGPDSVVLVAGGRAWTESDAAVRIAASLDWPARAFAALRLVPRPVRDALYRLVARNRYRWFGRDDACRLPAPEVAARMVADPGPGSG